MGNSQKLILCIGLYSYCMQSMHLFLTVAFKAMCRLPTKMAVRKPVHKDAYLLTKFYHMATVICLGSYRISFLMLWMANLIYCIVQSKQTVCTTWAQAKIQQTKPPFSWSIYSISRLIIHLTATYNYSKMYLILWNVGIYSSNFSRYDPKHKKRQNNAHITWF